MLRRFSLQTQLLVFLGLLMSGILTIITTLVTSEQNRSLRELTLEKQFQFTQSFVELTAEAIFSSNLARIGIMLMDPLREEEEVLYAFVQNAQGEIVMALDDAEEPPTPLTLLKPAGPDQPPLLKRQVNRFSLQAAGVTYQAHHAVLAQPIQHEGKILGNAGEEIVDVTQKLFYGNNFVGTLRIGFSQRFLHKQLAQTRQTMLIWGGGLLVASLLLLALMSQVTVRSLRQLVIEIRKVQEMKDAFALEYQLESLKLESINATASELSAVQDAFIVMKRHLLNSFAEMTALSNAFRKYVPFEFLDLLDKQSIVDVQLGDQVQKRMTILFSDIRSFTTLSESMSPQETFAFINSYLSIMQPLIQKHNGFIDKYIGDAIMALFHDPDDAVLAAIAMLHEIESYNLQRLKLGLPPIQIGIGINTGDLILGTIGAETRMESTVIADAVNLASRVEGLTKLYGVSLLITDKTFFQLRNVLDYTVRVIDKVRVKGKSEAVAIFDVMDGDALAIRQKKISTTRDLQEGITLYFVGEFLEAKQHFERCLQKLPEDNISQIYVQRCERWLHKGIQTEVNGNQFLEMLS